MLTLVYIGTSFLLSGPLFVPAAEDHDAEPSEEPQAPRKGYMLYVIVSVLFRL